MTKTLTEQWCDGTLPEGYYYTKGAFDDDIYISHFDYEMEEDKRLPVDEVLAPVPSYDKVKEMSQKIERLEFDNEALEMAHNELEKKLEIATKALKKLTRDCNKWEIARKALKEMEGVK